MLSSAELTYIKNNTSRLNLNNKQNNEVLFSINIDVLAKAMHEETSKHDADIRVMDALNNCHKQQDGGSDKNSCKTNFECKANHLFHLPVSPLSTLTAAGPVYDFPPSCFL